MTVRAEFFHPMHGHVAQGTEVVYPHGYLYVRDTIQGWVLTTPAGEAVTMPERDAYAFTQIVLNATPLPPSRINFSLCP